MRMWNINPRKMCMQHLLGEHLEMHMFLGSIKKKKSIKGFIKNNLVEVNNIINRHNELAIEISNRSKNIHKSDISNDDIEYLWKEGCVNKEDSEMILKNKCNNCRKLIEKYE